MMLETVGDLILIVPSAAWQDEYLAMAAENAAAGDGHYSEEYTQLGARAAEDFEAFVHSLRNQSQGLDLPPGHVPQSTFWLVRERDHRLLGASRLRHYLTEALHTEGGHLGYDIRATERRRGYGSQILGLTLREAGRLGLRRILIMCYTENIGSARIIEKNGGIPRDRIILPNGKELSRYWIDIPNHESSLRG